MHYDSSFQFLYRLNRPLLYKCHVNLRVCNTGYSHVPVPRAFARGGHVVFVTSIWYHLDLVCPISWSLYLLLEFNILCSVVYIPFLLHLFSFPIFWLLCAPASHNVHLVCNNLHVSLQHSPFHTRAKNLVPTPPRREHVADVNGDFAEVTSPCPKVIH